MHLTRNYRDSNRKHLNEGYTNCDIIHSVRGETHVSDSAYKSPYDSVHDLHANKWFGF
jgi:hypothetical protein